MPQANAKSTRNNATYDNILDLAAQRPVTVHFSWIVAKAAYTQRMPNMILVRNNVFFLNVTLLITCTSVRRSTSNISLNQFVTKAVQGLSP